MPTYGEMPESFIEQVKEALEKLYDFAALQESHLTRQFDTAPKPDPLTTGAHQLRSQLFDAIESLNPGQNVVAHSGTVRIYNLIYMHYVGRQTIQQAAWEIGVSLRQAYRDLRRGQELVSAVLWHALHAETVPPPDTSVSAELTRLEDNTTLTALQDLLDTAIRPVQILADKYAIPIRVGASADPIMLTTNPIMAQQILTHVLSQIIQQVRPRSLTISLSDEAHFIRVRYQADTLSSVHIEPIICQMMEQVHWELQYSASEGIQELALKSSLRRALLLVIDDNEGLIHLLQRYLTDNAYTVMSVPNTEQGIDLIPQLQPDVIILDLMMPGMDGWEVLQRIRTKSETKAIPVVICSVINDPELAFALGASQYVSKPVTREALLLALQAIQM